MSDSSYSKDEMEAKLDARDYRLENKVDRAVSELNSKIDRLSADIREGFMSLRTEMKEDSLTIRGEINVIKTDIGWLRWLAGAVIVLLMGILFTPAVQQLLHFK